MVCHEHSGVWSRRIQTAIEDHQDKIRRILKQGNHSLEVIAQVDQGYDDLIKYFKKCLDSQKCPKPSKQLNKCRE